MHDTIRSVSHGIALRRPLCCCNFAIAPYFFFFLFSAHDEISHVMTSKPCNFVSGSRVPYVPSEIQQTKHALPTRNAFHPSVSGTKTSLQEPRVPQKLKGSLSRAS